MLKNRISKPPGVTYASLKKGQAAHTTPAEQMVNASISGRVNFFFRKKTDIKLMNTGLVAVDSDPIPAETVCIATTYNPK